MKLKKYQSTIACAIQFLPKASSQNSLVHFTSHSLNPILKSLSLPLDRIFLLVFVVSSMSLNEVVVVDVLVVDEVVDGGEVTAALPITVWSKGQQMLGTLFVNPQENSDKNCTFSFEFWLSNIVAINWQFVIWIHWPGELLILVQSSSPTRFGRWNPWQTAATVNKVVKI